MKFKTFFFLIIIALSSISHAQWWVDGGNLIWPHGTVTIKKNLVVDGNTTLTVAEIDTINKNTVFQGISGIIRLVDTVATNNSLDRTIQYVEGGGDTSEVYAKKWRVGDMGSGTGTLSMRNYLDDEDIKLETEESGANETIELETEVVEIDADSMKFTGATNINALSASMYIDYISADTMDVRALTTTKEINGLAGYITNSGYWGETSDGTGIQIYESTDEIRLGVNGLSNILCAADGEIRFINITSDSTAVATGYLWFNASTGAIHRKF